MLPRFLALLLAAFAACGLSAQSLTPGQLPLATNAVAADRLILWKGGAFKQVAPTSVGPTSGTAGRAVLASETAATARSVLGLVIGTDVQAYSADLAAIAALGTTSFGRSLLSSNSLPYQPLNGDLTAIAAAGSTAFGRSFLNLADATAGRTLISAQQLNGELSAIAALSTVSFGRSLLTSNSLPYQPLNGDLTAISSSGTGSAGRAVLAIATTNGILAYLAGQPLNSDLTAISSGGTGAAGRAVLALATTNSILSYIGAQPLDGDLSAVAGLSGTGIVRRTATDTWTAGTAVGLATEVAGTLPVANGGTGITALGSGVATLLGGTSSGTGGIAGTASPTFTGTANFAAVTASADVTAGSTSDLRISGRIRYGASADGVGYLQNSAATQSGSISAAVPTVNKTSAYSALVTESGKTFGNSGATALVTITLPTGFTGLWYKFNIRDTDGIKVQSASGDQIRIAGTVSASTGYVQSVTYGSVLTLEWDGSDWRATSAVGTWVIDGTTTLKFRGITDVSTDITGFGTGVAAALGVNVGSAGAPVVNGGALGTPSSGTLANATGLPISTGVSGLGTGVATALATPTSANLATAITDEAGTGGGFVRADGATVTNMVIGVAGSSQKVAGYDSSGNLSFYNVSKTAVEYTANLTSDAQTQINAKGAGTVTSVAVTVPAHLSITGSPVTSSGTLAIGLSGTALPAANGGTAQTTYATGDTLYASAANTLSKRSIGTSGQVWTVAGGVPTWATPASGGSGTTAWVTFDGSDAAVSGFGAATFVSTSQTITLVSHGLTTGDVVWHTSDMGSTIQLGVPYYVTVLTTSTYKLSVSQAARLASTFITADTSGTNYSYHWVAGGTGVIAGSGVDGVCHNPTTATGKYVVGFSTAMTDANYVLAGSAKSVSAGVPLRPTYGETAITTTNCPVWLYSSSDTLSESSRVSVTFTR